MENTNYSSASKKKMETESTRQFLTFKVEQNEYGVDIMKVMEIRGWQEATRIPNSPEYMLGVINLRGLVIPIFDLRIRFSQGKTEANEKHVVIVINVGSRTVGILVDSVSDILTVNESEIKNNPSSSETGIDDEYVRGLISHSEKMVIVLDVDFLFDKRTLSDAEGSIN
ncbi:MAG TPA: chemotaxis protein CheW [Alphaproteobacteria bacterium]|nr:chemotaxis protein CheW [Alphaproteobacteria bacterium]